MFFSNKWRLVKCHYLYNKVWFYKQVCGFFELLIYFRIYLAFSTWLALTEKILLSTVNSYWMILLTKSFNVFPAKTILLNQCLVQNSQPTTNAMQWLWTKVKIKSQCQSLNETRSIFCSVSSCNFPNCPTCVGKLPRKRHWQILSLSLTFLKKIKIKKVETKKQTKFFKTNKKNPRLLA